MATVEMTRDALMVDPRLTKIVTEETNRLARALRLDTVDKKELYRSMVWACIAVAFAIADPSVENSDPKTTRQT